MPQYVVTAPDGRKVRLTGDTPPTDADLDGIFASLPKKQSDLSHVKIDPYEQLKAQGAPDPMASGNEFLTAIAEHPKEFVKSIPNDVFSLAAAPGKLAYLGAADALSKVTGEKEFGGNLAAMGKTGGEALPVQKFIDSVAKTNPKLATAGNVSEALPEFASMMVANPAGTLGKMVAAGFSAQMIAQIKPLAIELGTEVGKPVEQQDPAKIAQLKAAIIQTGVFAPLAGASVAHESGPAVDLARTLNKTQLQATTEAPQVQSSGALPETLFEQRGAPSDIYQAKNFKPRPAPVQPKVKPIVPETLPEEDRGDYLKQTPTPIAPAPKGLSKEELPQALSELKDTMAALKEQIRASGFQPDPTAVQLINAVHQVASQTQPKLSKAYGAMEAVPTVKRMLTGIVNQLEKEGRGDEAVPWKARLATVQEFEDRYLETVTAPETTRGPAKTSDILPKPADLSGLQAAMRGNQIKPTIKDSLKVQSSEPAPKPSNTPPSPVPVKAPTSPQASLKSPESVPEPKPVPEEAQAIKTPPSASQSLEKPILKPALLVDGKPMTGGDTHADIMQAITAQAKAEKNPKLLSAALDAMLDDSKHVFVDQNGKVYNRTEAAKALGREGELHSQDLPKNELAGIEPLRVKAYEGAPLHLFPPIRAFDSESEAERFFDTFDPNDDAMYEKRGSKWVVFAPEGVKPVRPFEENKPPQAAVQASPAGTSQSSVPPTEARSLTAKDTGVTDKVKPIPKETQATGLQQGSKVKLGSNPQPHTVIEVLPTTDIEKANGEQPIRVRNDRTGEEHTVLQSDAKPIQMGQRVRSSSVDTPAQGVLNQARKTKQEAWKRVKSLREEIKANPLGSGNLRLKLIRAEDAWREAMRMEEGAKQAIEKRANELGQTTQPRLGKGGPGSAAAGESGINTGKLGNVGMGGAKLTEEMPSKFGTNPPQSGESSETAGYGGDIYGVAERVRKARAQAEQVAPVERGQGISAPDSVDRGRQLLAKGANPDKVMQQFESTQRLSADDMAIARAHGENLARQATDAEVKHGTDSPEYRAAFKKLSDWDRRSKAMQTEWHKTGQAQQGETDIDTGTFTGLQLAHVEATGREFNPRQAKQANKFAKDSQKATGEAKQATQLVFDELDKFSKSPDVPLKQKQFWDVVRGYLNKGIFDFDDIRHGVANDLGLPVSEVTKLLAENKTLKRLSDDMYLKQSRVRQVKAAAKRWLNEQRFPLWMQYARRIPRALFGLKVFGHATVGIGTHAAQNLFIPSRWPAVYHAYINMWKYAYGKTALHEAAMKDLVRDPNFAVARRAGLVNDPYHMAGDYQSPEMINWLKRFGSGNNAFDALKELRQDIFNMHWNKLSESQKTPEMAKMIADLANHATGSTRRSVSGSGWANLLFFAPRLIGSRLMFEFGDPAKAIYYGLKSKYATPEERYFAVAQIKEKAAAFAVYTSFLAANAGLLAAMGSKQKINFTNPKEPDWLRFKGFGYQAAPFSPGIYAIRQFAKFLHDSRGQRSNFEQLQNRQKEAAADLEQYMRGELSPASGLLADQWFREDFMGRPLPNSPDKVPSWMRKRGIGKYTWPQYAATLAPIPIEQPIMEVWKHHGMGDDTASFYFKTLLEAGARAATGIYVGEDASYGNK